MGKVGKEERRREEEMRSLLFALLRAQGDPFRPDVREHGLDERDLAFEADLILPAEMEVAVYATQKRSQILSLLRTLHGRGLIEYTPTPPLGTYRVRLTPLGYETALRLFRPRPWWGRLMDLFRRTPPSP
jgi:hypothetical protein